MDSGFGLLILRVAVGAALLTHGYPKLKNFAGTIKWLHSEGFPLAFLSTCAVIFAEFFCSILLIIGAFTTYAAAIIAINMLVVIFFHVRKGQGWKQIESPLLFAAGALAIMFAGAGNFALF